MRGNNLTFKNLLIYDLRLRPLDTSMPTICITGKSRLTLERVGLLGSRTMSVFVGDARASATLEECVMLRAATAFYAEGGSILLQSCRLRDMSQTCGGVTAGGSLTVTKCHFSRCRRISIYHRAVASFVECRFEGEWLSGHRPPTPSQMPPNESACIAFYVTRGGQVITAHCGKSRLITANCD